MKTTVHKRVKNAQTITHTVVLIQQDIEQLGWFRKALLHFSLFKWEKQKYSDTHQEQTFERRDKRLQIILKLASIIAAGFAYMFALYCINVEEGVTPIVFSAALVSAFLLTVLARATQYILAELNCLNINAPLSAYTVNRSELAYNEMIQAAWTGLIISTIVWCVGTADFEIITKFCDLTDNLHIQRLVSLIVPTIIVASIKTIPRNIMCNYVCKTNISKSINAILHLILTSALIIIITHVLLILSATITTPISVTQ